MKRIILILMIISTGIGYASMWQTHTNTSHIYDILASGDELWFSSWGGVVNIAPETGSANTPLNQMIQKHVWNTGNGLYGNDIRHIQRIADNFWFATANNGISIVSPQGVQHLNADLGLPSNRVRKVLADQSHILVATSNGIADYYYLEGVNFPLLLHQYNVQNTGGALLSDDIELMEISQNRYLWISSAVGVNYVHLDSLAIDSAWHTLNIQTGFNPINHLAVSDEQVGFATARQVFLHSIDPWQAGWTEYNSSNGLEEEDISDIALDDEDNLWVAYGSWDEDTMLYSRTGAYLLARIGSDGVIRFSENSDGLKDKSISRVRCIDKEIYLGTWGDGIFRMEGEEWVQYLPNSIGFPKITHIDTDANYEAWFSSGNFNHLPTRKGSMGVSRWKDGQWLTMNVANSPIHSDNILTIAFDSKGRKWFGTYDVQISSPAGWFNGIAIWDEENDVWAHLARLGIRYWNPELGDWGPFLPNSANIMSNTIGYIHKDQHDNMWVAGYDRGISVINAEDELVTEFLLPNSVYQRIVYIKHNGRQYFFGTQNDRGLVIWNDDSIPVTGGAHWVIPPAADINNCVIYGVETIHSPYEGIQHWIAASNGLYMWDETNWYKYDTAIKRYRYDTARNTWERDILYYVDEERLYGSERTTPTAIYKDPFERLWIGSLGNGFSMYNAKTERFTNYFPANSPLLSSHITHFGYEPTEGLLLIGTPDGLNTLKIGRWVKPETSLEILKAYPNPFRPQLHQSVVIVNQPTDIMPRGKNICRIYDSSGALVADLEESYFSRFEWDGKNKADKDCASGVYFFVVTDEAGNSKKGKIVLIR
ncbi:MAG: hypothetical protein GX294_02555 [Candidatus Cloacimonetes bacterium]|nr:hypothetical protein [Candidatus Cloacimonadota bacterium]